MELFVWNVMIMEPAHHVKMDSMSEYMRLIMFTRFNVCSAIFLAKHALQQMNALKNMIPKIFTPIHQEEENVMKDNSNPMIMVNVFLVELVAQTVTNMVYVWNVKLLII